MSGDMLNFAEEPKDVVILCENGHPLKSSDNARRFFEAAWVHKYQGTYYLSYSTGDTHFIQYATSDNPYGPFHYKGKILEPVLGWTNHHSVVQHQGKWYLFYHDTQLSGRTHLRGAKVTELTHRPDVPTGVVLSEIVDLASEYSTDDSGPFVNGVLAAIAAEPAACQNVRLGVVNWTDVIATSALTQVMLDGLGYKTKQTSASQQIIFAGIRDQRLDLFLGYWNPLMTQTITPFVEAKQVKVLEQPSLKDARATLAGSLMADPFRLQTCSRHVRTPA